MMNFTWLFSYLTDSAFVLLYFRQDNQIPVQRKLWLKFLFILMLLPLYLNNLDLLIPYSSVRLIYRSLIYFAFLRYAEKASWQVSAYAAVFWTTVYVLLQNVFFGSYLIDAVFGDFWSMFSPFWSAILQSAVAVITRLVYLGSIGNLFPLPGMEGAGVYHGGFTAGVFFVAIYLQSTGWIVQNAFVDFPEQFFAYYILLHTALLVFLLVFEFSRRESLEAATLALQKTAAEALLENIRSRQQSEESIRSLRHDLQNHAITLQLMLEQDDIEGAQKYLDTFREQAATPVGAFRTGSDLLDGLLRQKLTPAIEKGTEVEVGLDFTQGAFIEPFDLCVLVGNLLDNAVEACEKVPADRRFIKVSGGLSANYLLLRVDNACKDGTAIKTLPSTSKANKSLHGFGLRNIQKVLTRYNGNLTVSSNTGRFTSTIIIPIPKF